MSNLMEAFGGRADPQWLIGEVNALYREGEINGEIQEGLIFAIKGRDEAESKVAELETFCIWLADLVTKTEKARMEAICKKEDAECRDELIGHYPTLQGTRLKMDIKKIGERKLKNRDNNLARAIKYLKEANADD